MKGNGNCFYIYITTNSRKTVLYTGVTNNLALRLKEHWQKKGSRETFAGKYYCFNLIYFEKFNYIDEAIQREKEIKKWSRTKKENLIASTNPEWIFLNEKICGCWPPTNLHARF